MKRFFKKPTFVLLLVLLPTVALALALVAQEDSGFLHIALARESDGAAAIEAMDTLVRDSTMIRYTVCDTPEEAERLVVSGSADAAWIFTEEADEAVRQLADKGTTRKTAVRSVERESSLLLQFAREKLAGSLYRLSSQQTYLIFTRTIIDETQMSDTELMDRYEAAIGGTKLLNFEQPSLGTGVKVGYLVAPMRGVLAVMMVLCAMTTALFFGQDEQKGTFSWVSLSRRPWMELACQVATVVPIGVVSMVSMVLMGVSGIWWREALLMLLYMLSCMWFAMLLRQLTARLHRLAILIPVLAVGMLAVCPVFIEANNLRVLQLLFPPSYYLYAAGNDRFAWYLLAYTAALAVLTLAVYRLRTAGRIFRKRA